MAIEVYDAVRKRRRVLGLWAAAAALCVGIVLAAWRAVKLIGGFVDGVAELLRQMFF